MSKLPKTIRPETGDRAPQKTTVKERELPGRIATKDETMVFGMRAAASLPADFAQKAAQLARSGMRDVLSDVQARALSARLNERTPQAAAPRDIGTDTKNTTLPAVISNALVEGQAGFDPNWHMVRNLPGYAQQAIRGYGRSIFASFTSAPIEEIQIVSTLSNSETEVKLMMAWIRENGIREDVAELDGSQVFGRYTADVQKWSCLDYSFLLVADRAGYYVYGWHRDFDNSIENEPRPCLPGR